MSSQSFQDAPPTAGSEQSRKLSVKRPIGMMVSFALGLGILVPVCTVVTILYSVSSNTAQQVADTAEESLTSEAFDTLVAVREIKKKQIEEYFERLTLDLEVFSRSRDARDLFVKLREYHDSTGVKSDGEYDVSTAEYQEMWHNGASIYEYCKDSGVYDLFMICTAHGHVMYTCAKESDLGTNLAHGPHKDSDLGRLWSKVKSTSASAFVDFEPYAPSNDQPAAFLGVPFSDDSGAEVGVLAVRIPLDQVNAIMQARDGLGETGETYLVGTDKLMRSDSFLDPPKHSVVASFKNPSTGSVDTETANAALRGETNAKLITDYRGSAVLCAYAPIDVYGTRWALLAEIDKTEALATAEQVQQIHNRAALGLVVWAGSLSVLCLVAIALVGVGIHRMIAQPIQRVAEAAHIAAGGVLDVRVPAGGKSEVGVLSEAINQMIESQKNVVDQANAIAEGDYSAEVTPRGDQDQLGVALFNMTNTLRDVVGHINQAGTEMVAACREQAEGTKNQTVTTEEMATTVSELTTAAQQMSESGGAVAKQAELAAKECAGGTSSVESAAQGITGIHERVEKIAEHMLDLGGKSQQVSGILDIITELSEQTNLLSLNASIEAAGAGDAGKRFAVVASEIRKLAERATNSTEEIRSLIDSIQETVNTTIMATEEGTKAVQNGVRRTDEVGRSFERIAQQVASTAESAKAIEMGNRQQATAIQQMESAVVSVHAAAQQTEATARQVDAEANALLDTARRLQKSDQQSLAM